MSVCDTIGVPTHGLVHPQKICLCGVLPLVAVSPHRQTGRRRRRLVCDVALQFHRHRQGGGLLKMMRLLQKKRNELAVGSVGPIADLAPYTQQESASTLATHTHTESNHPR